jgi:potassium-dependent mechanosensitive channel
MRVALTGIASAIYRSASIPRRISACRRSVILYLGCSCFATLAVGQSGQSLRSLLFQQQQNAPADASSAHTQNNGPANLIIPLPEVAARSEDLTRMLRSISNLLPTNEQLESAKSILDDRSAELSAKEKETDAVVTGTPSALELREEDNYWRTEQQGTASLRRQLFDWANAAQSGMQAIQAQVPAWQATLQRNDNTPGLEPTVAVIKQALADLGRLNAQAQGQLGTIVNLQVRAATQDQIAIDTLDRVNKAREYLDARLLERDSLPLWRIHQRRALGDANEFYAGASERWLGIRAFALHNQSALTFIFVLLVLSLFGAFRLSLAMRGFEPSSDREAEVARIARHWLALGLLGPILCSYILAPLAPVPLVGLAILVAFVPILTLLPPLIQPRLRLLVYFLAGMYLAHAVVGWSSLSPFHKRELRFAVDVLSFLLFAYLMRPRRISPAGEPTRHPVRILAIRVAIAILGASLIANLFGYVKLSQFLSLLCFYSTFVAVSMVTMVRVFSRLILEGVDTVAAQQLAVVRCYRDGMARWLPRGLQWGAALLWVLVTVNLLGIAPWLSAQMVKVTNFRIAGGSSGITLGGVLGFFLILLVGYAVSSAIRFLLREELLSRFHLARGLPELVASTLHYILLLLVFFFAVNAGGVELNKFTVLTGALGVGVGFGLQNIVNNFISGLILQFERPIHVGDVLDVDGAMGTVTRIGIRSSTIRTFQGAELIIPNGNFISGKVTNWTLTSPKRRLELPVGVAYGSDAKLVTELLRQAATTNESVLTDPPPTVYFKEFGDSALNFELHFWVMQESNTSRVKSEVALGVMELLKQADIEIPFPQRDLRLRAVDREAAAALIAPNELKAEYAADADAANGELFEKAQRQRAGE